ncbi:MAG TPA: FtsQ-type POTRA domain-containing protein, partial [Bacillota bacterium]|nr:FtsQ-type POTRA domain-containing protein [Bacillota bacterium]
MTRSRKSSQAQTRQRQRQLNRLQSLFFILLLVVGGYIFLQSSVFAIKDVTITGLATLQDSEIRKMAGINPGTNTFKLNLNSVKSRLAIHPMVKTVGVKRSFPDAIVISITERKPVTLVPLNSYYIALDQEGYYLYKVTDYLKANLPIITGLRLGNLTPGKQVVNDGLGTALGFLRKMDVKLVSQLSELNAGDPQMLIMY